MTKHKGLLVAIDPAEDPTVLLARAEAFARYLKYPVELFACEYDPYIAGERYFDDEDLKVARGKRLAEVYEFLEELAEPLRENGINVTIDVAWDHPAYEGFVRKALRSGPELVLCGKQFHVASDRAFFSNDDWNLIRTCPAPLLIVHPDVRLHDELKVWAAVDPFHRNDKPGSLDDLIVSQAQRLAQASGGSVDLVHTYSVSPLLSAPAPITPTTADSNHLVEDIKSFHLAPLNALARRYSIPGKQVHNLPGTPTSVLPELTRKRKVDLLVMGAVSRGFVSRVLLGSSAERVLDRLACDVLIVKPDAFATPVSNESEVALRDSCVA